MNRYLIVADDFTGANDTGVQLTRRGISTRVTLSFQGIHKDSHSYVLDTESRGLDAHEAYLKVKQQAECLDFSCFQYLIKKVDSTLRGNIAMEVKALDEVYQSELIIFMPALPDLKRTTSCGIHYLHGVPVTQTELNEDPLKPVTKDCLKEILEEAYDEPVRQIGLEEIRENKISLDGGRIFTFDAETNQDMRTVVKSAEALGKRTLWVGSAALADHLLEQEVKELPSMALVASVSETTRNQVKYAEKSGTSLVCVPVYEIMENEDDSAYVEQAVRLLSAGKDTILLSSASYDRAELIHTIDYGSQKGMKREAVSEAVQAIMGTLAKKILEKVEISGLFLTGGDTAMGFFEKAGCEGSAITGEMSTGIPMMRLTGGTFDGLKVITKAGAFGNEDAIFYGLRKLKEQI